jgi:hypothetical protein
MNAFFSFSIWFYSTDALPDKQPHRSPQPHYETHLPASLIDHRYLVEFDPRYRINQMLLILYGFI